MENKQPEDDLFDRLNVSGQTALGWRGVQPEPPKLLKERFAWEWLGLSARPVLGHLYTLPSSGTQQIHGRSPGMGWTNPACYPLAPAEPSLGWMLSHLC